MPGRGIGVCFLPVLLAAASYAAEHPPAPPRLLVAVAQTPNEGSIAGARDRMLFYIREAAARKARVVVFPEGALSGRASKGSSEAAEVSAVIGALQKAALKNSIYVIFGGLTRHAPGIGGYPAVRDQPFHWMLVIDPAGRSLFRYDKLQDAADAPLPGLFDIDGIPANAILGADRRLRGVAELPVIEGARLTFELANEPDIEWDPALGHVHQVTHALRNNVWVVLANTGNLIRPSTQDAGFKDAARHGHSAVIAPDGEVAASLDKREDLLFVPLDLSRATRAGASSRRNHGFYGKWWQQGLALREGSSAAAPAASPMQSPEKELTIAAAQVALAHDPAAILNAIRESAAAGARLVAFPARTLRSDASSMLEPVRKAAREAGIYVAIGAAGFAYVFSPEGKELTRYSPGGDPRKMWFQVDGVPAIVTMGERDALWSEISALASAAGAQLRVHLTHDTATGESSDLERRQVGAVMASYAMLTVVANAAAPSAAGHSAIWDDLRGAEEARAARQSGKMDKPDLVWMYSPWMANLVTEATGDERLLYATRRFNKSNPYASPAAAPGRLQAWLAEGVRLVLP